MPGRSLTGFPEPANLEAPGAAGAPGAPATHAAWPQRARGKRSAAPVNPG